MEKSGPVTRGALKRKAEAVAAKAEPMQADTALLIQQHNKKLRQELVNKERVGNGDFREVDEFQIYWDTSATYYFEGKHSDCEAATASLIQSTATNKKYVVFPKPIGHIIDKEEVDKAVQDTTRMLEKLKQVAKQI